MMRLSILKVRRRKIIFRKNLGRRVLKVSEHYYKISAKWFHLDREKIKYKKEEETVKLVLFQIFIINESEELN